MARKNYTDEFRQRAVDLFASTPGATLKGIAADLGISRGALREWVEKHGSDHDHRHSVDARAGAGGVTGGEGPPAGGREREAGSGEAEASDGAGHPSSGGEVFRRGDELVNRFQFVEDHKDAYGVKRLCEVIQIARSSFYAWLAAAPGRAARAAADAALAARIRVLQDPAQGGDRAYGAPRITADLNDGVTTAAERVNHKRVARVMREHQLVGIRLRRRVKTTIPDQSGRKFPDLIGRDFSIGEPNRRYVGDITYLPIADGSNLYLATCIDLGSRKLAGWQVADHMRTELVEDALKAAAATRGSLKGAVFHSDHGSVYCSKAYATLCRKLGVTQSMGAVGSSADNALAESFNATMKREVLQDAACWSDELTCRRQVFRWLVRYNTKRRHSWCRYTSPIAFETGYTATLRPAA